MSNFWSTRLFGDSHQIVLCMLFRITLSMSYFIFPTGTSVFLVAIIVPFLSEAFQVVTRDGFSVRGLLMTTFLPLSLSTSFGQIRTFFLFISSALMGNNCLSICISWKTNRPSYKPIVSADRKHCNRCWHEKRSYAIYNKLAYLIHLSREFCETV